MPSSLVQDWLSDGSSLRRPGKASRVPGGRNTLAWGTYLPDATNTGHTFTTPDATYTTNQSFNDTGLASSAKTIERARFSCKITLQGKNYVFRNCLFDGPVAGLSEAMVQSRYATADGNLFEDCTFLPQTPTQDVNAIQGRGFTLRRCNISGVIDGVDPAVADGGTRTDVAIYQTYIHDLLRYSPYSGHSDNQTHSDAIQWQGGLGLILRGNRIEDLIDITKGTGNSAGQTGTSALMINALNNTIPPGELIMEKNWVRGGYVGINSAGTNNTVRLAGAWEGSDAGTVINGNWVLNDQSAGTNHRWVGRSAQTQIDAAIAAGTNYVWNTSSPLSTATVLPSFKVNITS